MSESKLLYPIIAELLALQMAASGRVSGTLAEWPVLQKALYNAGLHLAPSTDAIVMRRAAQAVLQGNAWKNEKDRLS